MKTIKSFPLRWTDEPNRIRALFIKVGEKSVMVSSLQHEYIITLRQNEDGETLAKQIAERLAGQTLGDTAKIINTI